MNVAPYVGAWIETTSGPFGGEVSGVAPYVGAWIETKNEARTNDADKCRTLRGCVD